MADEIGVFYTPVEGVPSAWHAGVYYKRNYGNQANQIPETLEAYPERMPSGFAQIIEYGREKMLGERRSDTPFGRLVKRPGMGFPKDAIHHPLIQGLDLGHHWNGLNDTFDELDSGDYLYYPALQNSNSVVGTALSRNGIGWTPPKVRTNPRDPRLRPGDPPYITDPNFPWVPGADRPLIREQDMQRLREQELQRRRESDSQRPDYDTSPMGYVTGFPPAEIAPTGPPGLVSGKPMRFSPVQPPLFGVE